MMPGTPEKVEHPYSEGCSSARSGSLYAREDGTFAIVNPAGLLVNHDVPEGQRAELSALLELRNTVIQLSAALACDAPGSNQQTVLKQRLNDLYDAYADEWGPINRVTTRRTSWIIESRIRPGQGGFANDPDSALVYALEIYDESRNYATKADIFL